MTGVETVQERDPRRARTRAALILAAQQILAEDARAEVSIQTITETAGVGFGSFYNHFESKDALFHAAIVELMEAQGAMVDKATIDIEDPAEIYLAGVRRTGRWVRQIPQAARFTVNTGYAIITADFGLAPRALRDLKAAIAAGRFEVEDPEAASAAASGAVLGLIQYLLEHPEVDAGEASDRLAVSIARMHGMSKRQAEAIVRRPLPELR